MTEQAAPWRSLLRGANATQSRELVGRFLWLPDSARTMGINIMAGKGSGKSRLMGRVMGWIDFLRGVPLVVFDPVGGTIDNFLDKIIRLPANMQAAAWSRVLYVDVSGSRGHVAPAPLYYRLGDESLYTISQRYLDVVRKLDPHLQSASILGWNALWRVGTMTGMLLSALDLQITEAFSLLQDPDTLLKRYAPELAWMPEVRPVLSYFHTYAAMKPGERDRLVESFLNKIALFSLDPAMTAMFGAREPGLDWSRVIRRRQAVLLDFRHVLDLERRRFLMWWLLGYFMEFIKHRGHGQHMPVSLVIDELTALLNFNLMGPDPFLADLDALINVISRSHRVWLTTCLQQVWQVDPRIAKALLSMGTQIIGAVSDPGDAQELAQHLYRYAPYMVKKTEPVWMSGGFTMPVVVDHTTVEFTPEEQLILNAFLLQDTGLFRFLVRPAAGEGQIGVGLRPISIAKMDHNLWVEEELVARARTLLARRSGVPVARLLPEIQERLLLSPAVKRVARHGIVSASIYEPVSRDLQGQEEEEPIFWE